MEVDDWSELMLDDDDEEETCLAIDECIDDLLRDAPAGCLYCRLGELDEGDDE